MASANKIKEGLLHIIWDATYTPSDHFHGFHKVGKNTENPTQTQVDVSTLTDVVDSFLLTCQITEDKQIVLEIQILSRVGRKNKKPIKLESRPILIHATKERLQQKMTINEQLKWTATWDAPINIGCKRCITPIRCNYCGKENPLIFHILIDLTPDSVISSKNGSQHVLDHLLNLWNTKTLSDVTFNCKENNIKAHTLILASGSPVLAAMFQHNFKENQEKVVKIKDINPDVFEELLYYIYTGKFNSGRNVDVAELFVAADKYAVETLKEECSLILSRNLTVENAAQYLVLAHLHSSSKLHEASLVFISMNAKSICSRKDWMEITKNYPDLCFQATQLIIGLL
jgi:hypothetical protein